MEIQELITRGRFIFARAPGRLKVYELVTGRSSGKAIAKTLRKRLSNVLPDLKALRDLELIQTKQDKKGQPIKVDGSLVYEKPPLARQIPLSYFRDPAMAARQLQSSPVTRKAGQPRARALTAPSATGILDICKRGEDDITEFKRSISVAGRSLARMPRSPF
jgi:hypothetical protein